MKKMEKMENESITINVVMDAEIFRDFAVFDNLRRKRIWVLPLVFASIMSAFALVCFALRGRAEQAVVLGSVLLIIGLGLPSAYIGLFFKSIKVQIKAAQIEKPRAVYSLLLSREGVEASVGGERLTYEWGGISGVYRARGATYLYVEKNKAFILPDGQAEGGADVRAFLSSLSNLGVQSR